MDNIYVKGSTSVIVQVLLRSSSTGQGQTGLTYANVSGCYCRPGGTSTIVSFVSGAPGDSYTSNKFAEVDSVNMPGLYQVHLPSGCTATGANSTVMYYSSASIINSQQKIILIDSDLRNSTNLGLSNLDSKLSTISGNINTNYNTLNIVSGYMVSNSGSILTVNNTVITISGNIANLPTITTIVASGHTDGWAATSSGSASVDLSGISGSLNTISGNLNTVSNTLITISGSINSLPSITTIVSSGNAANWNSVASLVGISGTLATISGNLTTVSGNLLTLQNNIVSISGNLNATSGNVNTLLSNLATTSGNLTIISGILNVTSGNVNTIKTNIITISGNLNSSSGDINTLRTNFTTVSGNVTTTQNNVVTISGNLTTVSGNLNTVNNTINNVSGQINLNNSIISTVSGKVDNTLTTLIRVSGNITNNPITVSGLTPIALSQIVTSGNAQGWDSNLAIPEVSGDPGPNPTLNQASMLKYMELRNARVQGDPTLAGQYYIIYKNDGTPLASGTIQDNSVSGIFIKGKLQW